MGASEGSASEGRRRFLRLSGRWFLRGFWFGARGGFAASCWWEKERRGGGGDASERHCWRVNLMPGAGGGSLPATRLRLL